MTGERRGLLAAALLTLPVFAGIGYALAGALGLAGAGASGLDVARVRDVLSERSVWRSVGWTLWVAGASSVLATGAAALIAMVFRGGDRTSRFGRALATLPLPIPHLVAATLALLVLGQSGILARLAFALGVIEGPAGMPALVNDPAGVGMILSLAWKEIPFLVLVAASVIATRGEALEEVARTLGADRHQALRRVTLPLLWRGMAPSVVAVFIFAAGSYEVAVLLAPSDPLALPLLTYERYTDADLVRRGDAFVLTLLAFAIAGAAVAAHEWVRGRWHLGEEAM